MEEYKLVQKDLDESKELFVASPEAHIDPVIPIVLEQAIQVLHPFDVQNNNPCNQVSITNKQQNKWTNYKIGISTVIGFPMALTGILTKDLVPSELTIFLIGIGSLMFSIGFLSLVVIFMIKFIGKCYNSDINLNIDNGSALSNQINQINKTNVIPVNIQTKIPNNDSYKHYKLVNKVGFSLQIPEFSPIISSLNKNSFEA